MKNNVREYREYKGVSLRWLAGKVGCGTSTLCDIERGKSIPNVRLAIRIARVLGTTAEKFVGGRAMTETEWRTYLRREIERLLDEASEQKLRLTLALLRAA